MTLSTNSAGRVELLNSICWDAEQYGGKSEAILSQVLYYIATWMRKGNLYQLLTAADTGR